MFDPTQSKHWRFERQSGFRRSDFVDEGPRGVTFADALVFGVAMSIALLLFF